MIASFVAFLNFVSLQMLYLYLFPHLCMRSHPALHTPSHARSQAHTTHPSILSHMRHAQPDSWPRPPGGEDGAPSGRLVGGDEPGSSALSPDIHTQWVHSHMSDSVADWGRGTLRVAPSLVGGPQNCDGLWFISVHNYSYIHFCILLYCNISRSLDFLFLDVLGSPRADIEFFCCHLK